MPTLSNELRQAILKLVIKNSSYMTGSDARDAETVENIMSLIATQNTALLKELLGELPEEIDMMHAKKAHSDAGAGNVIGHNHLLSKVKNLINSKLAAMGEQ